MSRFTMALITLRSFDPRLSMLIDQDGITVGVHRDKACRSVPGRLYVVLASRNIPSGWVTASGIIEAQDEATTWTGTIPGGADRGSVHVIGIGSR